MIYPAISIMQPWAYAIFHLGKDCENRSWKIPPQYVGRPVLVHAGKKLDTLGLEYLQWELGYALPADLPMGGIVGYVMFAPLSVDRSTSAWAASGQYHWPIITSAARPFHPCQGRLGFFEVNYPHEIPRYAC